MHTNQRVQVGQIYHHNPKTNAQGTCCAVRNTIELAMIKSFKHKGLRRLYETGSTLGVQASHAKRLRMQLTALDTAQTIDDMDLPGFRLHPLKGELSGRWSITVSGNWRLTFEFQNGNAYVLDYEDYH
jgi:proteic killer suppression protein